MNIDVRRLVLLGSLAGALVPLAVVVAQRPAMPTSGGDSRPVVIAELFTSEGCSSCPPADDLLREIDGGSLSDGIDVVVLGEHVDYWDRLGWRDRFSSPLFSARQSEYAAKVFRTGRIYTPQLVVDGTDECVGSDAAAVRRTLAAAARRPKAAVTGGVQRLSAARVRVRPRVNLPASLSLGNPADMIVAVIEGHLHSRVAGGENGGRTLRHAAVARLLTTIGSAAASERSYSADAEIAIAPEWNPANLQVVAFVQERESRRIVGAGSTALARAAPEGIVHR